MIKTAARDTNRPMACSPLFRAPMLAGLLLSTSLVSACGFTDCTDQGCVVAYSVSLEATNGTLDEGAWHLALTVDGHAIEAECMAPGELPEFESVPCTVGPWQTGPEQSVEVFVRMSRKIDQGSGEPTDTGDLPPPGNEMIVIEFVSNDQEAPLTNLDFEVLYGRATVLDAQTTPSYETEEDFGGPGCGTCLRSTPETFEIP